MVFCSRCGSKCLDDARFCPSCGSSIQVEGGGVGAGLDDYKRSASPAVGASSLHTPSQLPRSVSPNQSFKSMGSQGSLGGSSSNVLGGPPQLQRPLTAYPLKDQELSPILEQLKFLYKTKIRPVEEMYKFNEFHSPCLTDTDFDAKPMVLLLGQYSTGKTTFIRFLLERDFPGCHVGPEPTTDRFMAVMWGRDERTIPGNALAASADMPFTALSKFGMAFLNKFEASQCPSPILEKLTFIDTPGVLSGEKQRIGRAYDFPEIIEWFAERADRILLLFDAHKLDISDEFKSAIETLRGHDDKIRVVLNKADLEMQHLMRVYGALMWSLGKVIKTPEVLRVYIGSFWDQPLKFTDNAKLLMAEQEDLLADLRALPRNSTVRKINELVKRARMAKVHAHIISHLRDQFGMFGKKKLQEKLISGMGEEFKKVQHMTSLPAGDFPHVGRFKDAVSRYEIHKFPKMDPKKIAAMDDVLANDIPKLMRLLPQFNELMAQQQAHAQHVAAGAGGPNIGMAPGGPAENPFAINPDRIQVQSSWAISGPLKSKYDNEFYSLELSTDNKVSGQNAKKIFLRSKLSQQALRHIWDLADIDKDGALDSDEFAVAMYLLEKHQSGEMPELPDALPADIMPPSKRGIVEGDSAH